MKKIFFFVSLSLCIVASIYAAESDYKIGDRGPAGGIIFYDKGKNSNGWRYLEAAPADIRVIDGIPSVDISDSGYSSGIGIFAFGKYYSGKGVSLCVGGTTGFSQKKNTKSNIGAGEKNTELLVAVINTPKDEPYAAKLCSDLVYNGFDDWFLPSLDELRIMYKNLKESGLSEFDTQKYPYVYWTSHEMSGDIAYAIGYVDGSTICADRIILANVRAIRSF